MSRVYFQITSREAKDRICRIVQNLPFGTWVEMKENKRTTEQGKRMWAMLSEFSMQARHHGMKLSTESWKFLFLDALFEEKRERMNLVPSLSGRSVVPLGRSSSDLTVSEMSDLIELIHAHGAEKGVVFNNPKEQAA